jgi:uncharacterized LabA/DUF88 family protein
VSLPSAASPTNVYIDGFNLYYGCLKGSAFKWLDLEALCTKLLPSNDIRQIHYCTARIKARPDNVQAPTRQGVYLAALGSLPKVTVHFGHFLESRPRMRLAKPPAGGPNTVQVIKNEEKGSDVNLATWLLVDAYEQACETAVLITNDSDLAEPMAIVSKRLGVRVGLINPHPRAASAALIEIGKPAFVKSIRRGALAASQFPTQVVTGGRTLHRPVGW